MLVDGYSYWILDCDCVSSKYSVQVPGASRGSDLRAGEQGFRSLHALRLRLALTRRGLHAWSLRVQHCWWRWVRLSCRLFFLLLVEAETRVNESWMCWKRPLVSWWHWYCQTLQSCICFFFHWDTYWVLTNIACIRSDHRWNNAVVSARNVLAIQWLYPVSLRSSQWLGQPARLYHLLLLAQPFPTLLWALLSAKNWFDSTLPSSLSQSSCCWVKTIWEKLALWYELITYHLCSHKNCLLLFCPFKSSFLLVL